jgi:hypothetical protein
MTVLMGIGADLQAVRGARTLACMCSMRRATSTAAAPLQVLPKGSSQQTSGHSLRCAAPYKISSHHRESGMGGVWFILAMRSLSPVLSSLFLALATWSFRLLTSSSNKTPSGVFSYVCSKPRCATSSATHVLTTLVSSSWFQLCQRCVMMV